MLYAALVTGVLGLLKDGREVWRDWNSKPDVRVSSTTPLAMKYEPGNRTVTFSFGLVLHNEGNKAEMIRDATAQIAFAHDANRHFDFSRADVSMKEGGAGVPINLPIGKDVTRSVVCEVSTLLTDDLRNLLQQPDTRRIFVLTLTGMNEVHSVRFRFDLGTAVLAYVLDPKATTAREVQLVGSDLQSTP